MEARMPHRRDRFAMPLIAFATALMSLLWFCAGRADAICYGSTPASSTFADSFVDGGGAPEVYGIDIDLNAGCGLTVDTVTDSLISGDAVFTYLNVDGNPTTGDVIFSGADRVVGVLGPSGSGPPILAPWNGTTFDFVGAGQALPAYFDAGFITNLNQLGVPAPTTLGLIVGSLYSPLSAFDFAPDVGAYGFPVGFSTSPPPPPPPPPPAAAPVPVAPTVSPKAKKTTCKVPKVRRLTIAKAQKKLSKAGCKYKIRGKGRVVSTTPKAGSETSKTVIVKAKKRKRSKRSRRSITSTAHTLQHLEQAFRSSAPGN
jgi:PASTA domain-containing protein